MVMATRSTTGHLDLNHRNQGARLMMMMMMLMLMLMLIVMVDFDPSAR